MANLKKQHQSTYYESRNLYGNYQFVSLFDVIDQFMVAYVGDEKIINKVSRTDVAFFAQRALAELSFDTFKSFKSQQIDVPSSLTMILPHDYVNYTKLSWTDSSGIKHPLYYTNDTSNPFEVRQHDDGSYDFPEQYELLLNNNFEDTTWVQDWERTMFINNGTGPGSGNVYGSPHSVSGLLHKNSGTQPGANYVFSSYYNPFGAIAFTHGPRTAHGSTPNVHGTAQAIWQKIDVSDIDFLTLDGEAETSAAVSGSQDTSTSASGSAVVNAAGQTISSKPYWEVDTNNFYASDNAANGGSPQFNVLAVGNTQAVTIPATTIRIGISSKPGSIGSTMANFPGDLYPTENASTDLFDIGYVEWTAGERGFKEIDNLDVSAYSEVYGIAVSIVPWGTDTHGQKYSSYASSGNKALWVRTALDNISVKDMSAATHIQSALGNFDESSTWRNYKSNTPSEINTDDYEDDTLWPYNGERYGLEPTRAQVNGSFYIDDLRGKIHFSSNISGKTVILDYISDSLGADSEMQVHKLAEEAMYKHILCSIMSGRRGGSRGQLAMYKKDKFAATRQAKLRLSNFKLEDLTRVLRGKSKQIKH